MKTRTKTNPTGVDKCNAKLIFEEGTIYLTNIFQNFERTRNNMIKIIAGYELSNFTHVCITLTNHSRRFLTTLADYEYKSSGLYISLTVKNSFLIAMNRGGEKL